VFFETRVVFLEKILKTNTKILKTNTKIPVDKRGYIIYNEIRSFLEESDSLKSKVI
jgi:hypothetical protein